MTAWKAVAAAVVLCACPVGADAIGNLASKPERLPPLKLGGDLSFAPKEYRLETGKYYIWRIESDGGEEFLLQAPDLFRHAWINQIVINDIEVKPSAGGVYGVEFDREGAAEIFFVPIMPGTFDFFAQGFEERGMLGRFVVE